MAEKGVQMFMEGQSFEQSNSEHTKMQIRLLFLQLALRFFDDAQFRDQTSEDKQNKRDKQDLNRKTIKQIEPEEDHTLKPRRRTSLSSQPEEVQEQIKKKLQSISYLLKRLQIQESVKFSLASTSAGQSPAKEPRDATTSELK